MKRRPKAIKPDQSPKKGSTKIGEIVVIVTDKSGKLSVSSRSNYSKQGEPHVIKDERVSWKDIEKAKAKVTAHTKAVTNIFGMGKE